ncbi:MAG TPA: thioredoxin domain-containing protein [Reyranella sp.]|nr:thioredoxin domain-containing protein [Reyranella sp.]
MRNILIVVAGVAAVILIACGVYYGTRQPAPKPAPVAAATTPDKAALLKALPDDHVEGSPNAPITLIEYASFTCPHCAHFNVMILPEIKTKWIDTGKLKLVYRDYPLDQTAAQAAQLARCAPADRYFGVVDMIFRTQGTWALAQDPIAELSKSLRIAGIGESEAKACLANSKIADEVVASAQGGDKVGVKATPSLFINGELFSGARSVEELDGVFAKLVK